MSASRLTLLSIALLVGSAVLGAYWLFFASPVGLPIPRQVVLGLAFGLACFCYGCGVGRRRERLLRDGRIDHGFVNKLIVQSLSLTTATLALALPTLYLLASYAIEGTLVSAPEIEARLPSGYSLNFVLGLSALGALLTTAYTAYGYLDHVNAG